MSSLPPETRDELAQSLEAARAHAQTREVDSVRSHVASVESLLADVPDGELRSQLKHGCETVDRLVEDEPLVAAEYLRSMHELVVGGDTRE